MFQLGNALAGLNVVSVTVLQFRAGSTAVDSSVVFDEEKNTTELAVFLTTSLDETFTDIEFQFYVGSKLV